jgi:hypothetical protein
MQTEVMNFAFMKNEALKVNPRFWLELIVWDGDVWRYPTSTKAQNYTAASVPYNTELYKGWVQYSMWILLPRVVREWRAVMDTKENWWPYFQTVVDAVVAVHRDPTLERFWRQGKLVTNPARPHPMNALIPNEWANVDRWFHLTTNLDPDLSNLPYYMEHWKADPAYRFQVFSLARTIGEKPNREWLVYAHAPTGGREDVLVTIPDFRQVNLPHVEVRGTFYLVREADGGIVEVAGESMPAPTGLRLQ